MGRKGTVVSLPHAEHVACVSTRSLENPSPRPPPGLDMDLVAAGWLMGLVSAIGAVCGLFIGRLTDQLNHRRSMILGLLLLAAGSLAGAPPEQEFVLAP